MGCRAGHSVRQREAAGGVVMAVGMGCVTAGPVCAGAGARGWLEWQPDRCHRAHMSHIHTHAHSHTLCRPPAQHRHTHTLMSASCVAPPIRRMGEGPSWAKIRSKASMFWSYLQTEGHTDRQTHSPASLFVPLRCNQPCEHDIHDRPHAGVCMHACVRACTRVCVRCEVVGVCVGCSADRTCMSTHHTNGVHSRETPTNEGGTACTNASGTMSSVSCPFVGSGGGGFGTGGWGGAGGAGGAKGSLIFEFLPKSMSRP